MTEMTWPQFKHAHSELENEEISRLWKRFKEGKYLVGAKTTSSATEEAPRDEKEMEELTDLEDSDNIDPNHGHDLNYIQEVEEEMAEEDPIIEPTEPPQEEETPVEVIEQPPVAEKPKEQSNEKLAKRLRDNMIYGI